MMDQSTHEKSDGEHQHHEHINLRGDTLMNNAATLPAISTSSKALHIGLWVAQDLGEGYTLAEMAEWNGTELRSRIGASLAGMADCD